MNNKKYTVIIEEIVTQEFEVTAENEQIAIELSISNYKNGKFVLEHGEVQSKQIAITKTDEDISNWISF